jgi:mannan endo-1,4-beta-mannosidase
MKNYTIYRTARHIGLFLVLTLCISTAVVLTMGCAGAPSPDRTITYTGTSDPQAIDNAKSLLRWLYTLPDKPGKRVLSGQEIGCYDGPQGYYDYAGGIERRTGKLPALIETDYYASIWENFFIDAERKNEVLRKHWEAGGLVALHLNFPNPWTGGEVHDTGRGSGSYSDCYTPGTDAYSRLRTEFDAVAERLIELQKHGVVVLFRPFHEVNGGWFWWYSEKAEEFKQMWRYWHTYLRESKGVHNILWVYSPSPLRRELFFKQGPHRYYPGGEYVDINALDLYEHDLGDRYRGNYTAMVELGKPVGFGELGGDFPPTERNLTWNLTRISDAMENHFPEAVYWLSWSSWGKYGIMAMEQLPDLEELFAHPLIASLEDVDFPRTPSPLTEEPEAPDPSAGSGDETSKVRVGFIDFTPGYVLGVPDYFETAVRTVSGKFSDRAEIVPVRGLYVYRLGNAVTRLVEEEDCSIIFVNQHDESGDHFIRAARKYPEVIFVTPAGYPVFEELPNIRTYGVNDTGWDYLIGIAAGAVTRTGKIGYVAHSEDGWNIENVNEFALGVAEVNGSAEVLFIASEGRDEEAIRRLASRGCDVFNQVASWQDIIYALREAAEDDGVICAFSNSLSREVDPDIIAAGMPEDLGELFSQIIEGILTGNELPDPYWTDFRSGLIRIDSEDPPFTPKVRRILQSAPAPTGSGAESVYEFILETHRELTLGKHLPLDGFDGFRPNIRRHTLQN